MVASEDTNWDSGEKSRMVSVGTHKLYLSVSGPDRKPGEPIVLLMQGLGSIIDEWVAVRRLVTPFARWAQYDRSGMGRSESPPELPEEITAVSVAIDLNKLLKCAGLEPPFIVVCHSWGGITSRELFHLRPNDIVGMVFVDANTEDTFDCGQWNSPFVDAMFKNQDYVVTTGLASSHVLSEEEWEAVMKMTTDSRHQKTQKAEAAGYLKDSPVLAAKKQYETKAFGSRPVSVLMANASRDTWRMYEAGVAAGNGTDGERREFQEWFPSYVQKNVQWQNDILKLSSSTRFVSTEKSGHNVQMQEPELVAEEIRWVWQRFKDGSA